MSTDSRPILLSADPPVASLSVLGDLAAVAGAHQWYWLCIDSAARRVSYQLLPLGPDRLVTTLTPDAAGRIQVARSTFTFRLAQPTPAGEPLRLRHAELTRLRFPGPLTIQRVAVLAAQPAAGYRLRYRVTLGLQRPCEALFALREEI